MKFKDIQIKTSFGVICDKVTEDVFDGEPARLVSKSYFDLFFGDRPEEDRPKILFTKDGYSFFKDDAYCLCCFKESEA